MTAIAGQVLKELNKVWDEQIAEYARFPERARDRPFDPDVRAAAAVLAQRYARQVDSTRAVVAPAE